ncbi:putative lipopolysaccharide heptosyltransferase III [Rahnella sikkimica]|uniref:Lipopolysaccharide heptosyltransferase 3 n=1 Tax=Rahnella sikkimica TaxID=1805933 RepID=A0A2L1UUH5_9GAMM|nr:putative lipopolysaccharide heptosyltransferase III [Rahnella sikkimica]
MMTTAHAQHPGSSIRRILIIKLRHHGDMLLTTPVVNTLKARYPDAEIDMLIYQETRDMLAANPSIHHLHCIDRTWKKLGVWSHMAHEIRLMKQVMSRHYDLTLNLSDQWRSAIATRLTGAPVRLGFDFPKRQSAFWRFCHTQLVSTKNHHALHTVEQNLSLLEPLQISSLKPEATMSYAQEDGEKVQHLLQQNQVSGRYIVVQPTSRWFFKCWSEEKMAAMLTQLHAEGYPLVITSGPDKHELDMVDRILKLCPQINVTSLAGKLTLPQLAALIDGAALFIGVDSVPMHMAAALKTPLVALFGPSKLVFWRPWDAIGEVIWAGDYGPLPDPDNVDTNTSERYLNAIPVDVVTDAARRLLA